MQTTCEHDYEDIKFLSIRAPRNRIIPYQFYLHRLFPMTYEDQIVSLSGFLIALNHFGNLTKPIVSFPANPSSKSAKTLLEQSFLPRKAHVYLKQPSKFLVRLNQSHYDQIVFHRCHPHCVGQYN